MKLTINIDGGSRGNPGPAAYGCYILGASETPIKLKGKLGHATNNVAEYHGLLRALEKSVELGADEVHIRADSELLVRQMTGVYKVKNEKIAELKALADGLIKQLGKVHFQHVYREQNTVADELCNEALDDPRLPIESLGLHKPLSTTSLTNNKPARKIEKQPPDVPASSIKEYVKVKLQGSLLKLKTSQQNDAYAVVANGVSWRLAHARVPSKYKSGDAVVVLGELELKNQTPIISVRSIRKA